MTFFLPAIATPRDASPPPVDARRPLVRAALSGGRPIPEEEKRTRVVSRC